MRLRAAGPPAPKPDREPPQPDGIAGGLARNNPSARRRQLLCFTCNLCGERNRVNVNPQVWQTGTLFVRCECCSVIHKLIDNLEIEEVIDLNSPDDGETA